MKIFFLNSKRKPKLLETDRCKEIYKNFFRNFLNINNIKHYSRNSSLGAVFAEKFNRTIRDFLKRPVFENKDGNWVDILPSMRNYIMKVYIRLLN